MRARYASLRARERCAVLTGRMAAGRGAEGRGWGFRKRRRKGRPEEEWGLHAICWKPAVFAHRGHAA
eukprot:138141-Rhodomonas_salina.1